MAGSLISDISNFVNKNLGIDTGDGAKISDPYNRGDVSSLPWGGASSFPGLGRFDPKFTKNEAFFKPVDIDPFRWNRLYPYRLLVIDARNNSVIGKDTIAGAKVKFFEVKGNTGLEYIYTQEPVSSSWEIALPISPQQLTIQDQFAINTSATMRGIVEEHNGIKFKTITAAGTTGIWARKPTRAGSLKSPSSLGSIFGGTLDAFNNLANAVDRVSSVFAGDNPNKTTPATEPFETEASEFSTGYYQALYLAQFLERYAQAKKDPKNKHWRLVFDIPKQNKTFVVTPVNFSLQQSQQKPNEIMFNMQFKAWKRVDLNQPVGFAGGDLPTVEANLFQRVNGTLNETRRLLSQATNLIKAVRGDVQGIFNVLRQTSLVVKDLGGLIFTAADLPRNIANDYDTMKEAIKNNLEGAFKRPVSRGGSGRGNSVSTTNVAVNPTGNVNTTESRAGQVVGAVLDSDKNNEGLNSDAVSAGALGSQASQLNDIDPLNNVFQNPEENFELYNAISVDDMNLSVEQQEAFDIELENARLITIDDLREFKQEIQTLALEISNTFGAGDSTFSSVYGRPDPRQRIVQMSVEENEILAALYEVIQSYDLLTATKRFNDLSIQSPLEYVGGLANEAGIAFDDFPSKTLVPVPFGSTIEEIAARYLGNSDKWIEIATINSLRSPYIDEEGFVYEFLSNGEGRQFTVNNEEDRLFLGQRIILQSDTVPSFARKIINIEEINNTTTLVTVDGEDNLESLLSSANARMQGYLPGTVNSQNQIYIPVATPAEEDDRTFEIPQLNDQNLTKISKVDFLLTEQNDIALNSLGDFRLANGLTNLIQALRMKVITQRGTLLRHLDFGLGLEAGVSVADIEDGQILKSMNRLIATDPRFNGLERFTVRLAGSTLAIDMAVRIANDSGVVPISFDVRA